MEDYSNFCKNIFETLGINKIEHKNKIFVLSLLKKLKQFSILRGHPQLTKRKKYINKIERNYKFLI